MTKREFLDIVFALAPNEANAIMDAFDEYVDSNEPHWIPVTERLPEVDTYRTLTTIRTLHKGTNVRSGHYYKGFFCNDNGDTWNATDEEVLAWMPLPEPYKEVTT